MTKTALWDEEFLKSREPDQREDELAKQNDADWQSAIRSAKRAWASQDAAYLQCPTARCRRARRCTRREPICDAWLSEVMEPQCEQEVIEDVYADIQLRRRAAAQV